MDCKVIAVSTKGQLVIPSDIRAKLGIRSGTRVALTLEGGCIVLQPISEELVERTRGILAGGPSLSNELHADRRADKW